MNRIITFAISTLILSALWQAAAAQDKILEISGEEFTEIAVSNSFEVKISQGCSSSVKIFADPQLKDYLNVRVSRGKLHIGMTNDNFAKQALRIIRDRGLYAEVTVPRLERLSVSEASQAEAQGHFVTDSFSLSLSGASSLEGLDIEAREAEITLSGAASVEASTLNTAGLDMTLSGASSAEIECTSDNAEISLSGGSTIKSGSFSCGALVLKASGASGASTLSARTLDVNLSGCSKAKVSVKESILSVRLSGMSSLEYSGEGDGPVIKDISISSGGRMERF